FRQDPARQDGEHEGGAGGATRKAADSDRHCGPPAVGRPSWFPPVEWRETEARPPPAGDGRGTCVPSADGPSGCVILSRAGAVPAVGFLSFPTDSRGNADAAGRETNPRRPAAPPASGVSAPAAHP